MLLFYVAPCSRGMPANCSNAWSVGVANRMLCNGSTIAATPDYLFDSIMNP